MSFDRDRLPDPVGYFEGEGLRLQGRGTWRTTSCPFHGGGDSMRINVSTGAWVCMNCHARGGDVVAFHMQRHGLDFVAAAKALGAWVEDGKPAPTRPRAFSAADAIAVLSKDLHLCAIVLSAARRGVLPTDADWRAFLAAAGRCITIAEATR
ncbi:CHC2 zinc finger domain-containing protein [Calidifontimicrobium sp. SYSU G02091]|uniref:CHC2 zinc finger domain-containing protein n=1 Tax=Calidifontimicrobium sp. SYSU G02091 TaxID=2926421 RepID=UPI001F53164A|nr:CHC2 zinc finger domain-containing protein [Calidifontimicrobium sp. SYSU G02091]MCI1191604.1 CHC2 zinc finger domain-containing protein [Calidifontimicrobium sp. SYSU G02091]